MLTAEQIMQAAAIIERRARRALLCYLSAFVLTEDAIASFRHARQHGRRGGDAGAMAALAALSLIGLGTWALCMVAKHA